MTVIARFEVIPVREGSMSTAIAHALRALDRYPVSYETTATDTVIEAETVDQVFEAVQAAHQAIPDDRVITSVEVDEDRRRPQSMHERVASVEQQLGHPPQRTQEPARQQAQSGGTAPQRTQPPRTTWQTQPAGSAPVQQPSSGAPAQQPAGGQPPTPPAGQSTGPGTAPPPRSQPGSPTPPGR